MDSVEGQTLTDYLHHARSVGKIRPGADMVQLFTSLSLAVDYAHQQGIIHGNLNPGSVLLRRSGLTPDQIGEPVLTDFDYTRLLQNPDSTLGPFYLISEHMAGAIQSPQTTPDQRRLAVQVNMELDAVIRQFEQGQHDAKQLVTMNQSHLLQPSALALLNNLATQAQYAYTGQIDPATGQPNGGALRIYGNLQRLAAFEIRLYVGSAQ